MKGREGGGGGLSRSWSSVPQDDHVSSALRNCDTKEGIMYRRYRYLLAVSMSLFSPF